MLTWDQNLVDWSAFRVGRYERRSCDCRNRWGPSAGGGKRLAARRRGGRTRPEHGGPPALKLRGTADCTAPDPATSGNTYYYRYLDYQLVDLNNNKVPTTQHYTVYEQLSAAEVRRLRGEGLSWRAIAAEIGVPKDTLRRSVLPSVAML